MHPVLFELPLPSLTVPLGAALLVVALVGLVVAALGLRARTWDLVLLGATAAVTAGGAALRFRGETIATGPLPLYGFGVMLTVALIAGWVLAQRLAVEGRVSGEVVARAYFATAVAGLIGARALYVLTNLDDFRSIADALAFREGGLVFYGGVFGGFGGSLLSVRGTKVPFAAWADIAAPCLALGALLGRIGCYLAGCDYGVPLGRGAPGFLQRLGTFPRWPDAVAGPGAGSPAWIDHVLTRRLSIDSTASLPVHPTQLYECAALGALLVLLLRQRRTLRFPGEGFLTFVSGYAVLRFLVETLRDDPERGTFGPMGAPATLWSVGFAIIGATLVLGATRGIADARPRLLARATAVLAAPALFAFTRHSPRGHLALSTSQWIALGTSIAAAVAWRRWDTPRAVASVATP